MSFKRPMKILLPFIKLRFWWTTVDVTPPYGILYFALGHTDHGLKSPDKNCMEN